MSGWDGAVVNCLQDCVGINHCEAALATTSKTPAGLPMDLPGTAPKFKIVTRGAEKASEEEIVENSRAASVRVRAIERLEGMPEFLPPGGRQ